jgi:Amt family ammonium transporter
LTIGIIAGAVCYFAVALKNRWRWDDALDVWGVHGVGGILGVILLGIFAQTAMNPNGANGLLFGNATFLGKEVASVIGASAYAFGISYGMLRIINKITRVRVEPSDEELGLDSSIHGEAAYEDRT